MPPLNQKAINLEIKRQGYGNRVPHDVATKIVQQMYGTFPPTLYKYMSIETFDKCLQNDGTFALRATQPSALNDVAEGIADICPPDDHRALCFISDLLLSLGFSVDDSIPNPRLHLSNSLKEEPGQFQGMFKMALSGCVGVISFSEPPFSLSMLGTYAEANAGFAVEFSTEKLDEHVTRHSQGRIQYLEQPLRIEAYGSGVAIKHSSGGVAIDEELSQENFAKVLFCKSKEWCNEREFRYLIPLDIAEHVGEAGSHPIHVVRVPSCAISKVIFGPLMANEKIQEYGNRIRNHVSSEIELCTISRRLETYETALTRLDM